MLGGLLDAVHRKCDLFYLLLLLIINIKVMLALALYIAVIRQLIECV